MNTEVTGGIPVTVSETKQNLFSKISLLKKKKNGCLDTWWQTRLIIPLRFFFPGQRLSKKLDGRVVFDAPLILNFLAIM